MESILKHNVLFIVVTIALVVGILMGYVFGIASEAPERNGLKTYVSEKNMDSIHTEDVMQHEMNGMVGNLQGKTGDEFEKTFLSDMIVHHQGAIDMAKLVLTNSKRPELLKLADDIIVAQTKEINMMKSWGSLWFNVTPVSHFKEPSVVACTMEAKICPDGSAVGRQGPHCEFAPCPSN